MKPTRLSILIIILFALPVFAQAALSDYFVNTDWLAANRGQVVAIDVRATPLYLLGHVDGALSVEKSRFLETRNQVKSLVPTGAALKDLLSSLGVSNNTALVVYAEDNNPYSARLVWTLRYHGHEQAYVLDGGYEKWKFEERAASILPTNTPAPSQYVFARNAKFLKARTEADYLYTRLETPGVVIWDTRSDGEFDGSNVRADRGGHIPGAIHLNWTELQKQANGVRVLKSQEEILALLSSRGLTPDKEIIPHCQTGIRSSYATLVLLGLGFDNVKNYDGSWIEWANNPTLPIIDAKGLVESSVQVSAGLAALEQSRTTLGQGTH